MRPFLLIIAICGLAACDGAGLQTQPVNNDPYAPWAPDEQFSSLGKKDCSRPVPPAGYAARSKYDRVCWNNFR